MKPLTTRRLAWIGVCVSMLWPIQGMAAEDTVFPRNIEFKLKRGAFLSGSLQVSFQGDPNSDERYLIKLSNLGFMGFTSDKELWTYIFKDDLALYGTAVVEKGTRHVVRKVFLDPDCRSAIDRTKTRCFKYEEAGSTLQTEIFAPYRAMDLASSMVVVAEQARKGAMSDANFNLIVEKTTKQATLKRIGKEKIEAGGKKHEAIVFSLQLKDSAVELYRFFIGRDRDGFYPLKITFTDEGNQEVQCVAQSVRW